MSFVQGDKIRVKPDRIIKKELHNAKGVVKKWYHDEMYLVTVNGIDYALHGSEMEKRK